MKSEPPIFEIRTVEVVNRGIALMPIAVKQRLEEEFPGASFAIPPYCYRTTGVSYAVDHGLYPLMWDMQMWDWRPRKKTGRISKRIPQSWKQFGHAAELLPQSWCDRFGLIKESSVDVVIETKGFIFSDQWGISPVREAAHSMKRWKKKGKKVILLPQAFGPFENQELRDGMKVILDGADLVFAREKTSFDFLKDISPDNPHIKQAPDFTNLLEGIPPQNPENYRDKIAIIPNERMLDKTGDQGPERFRLFLQQAVRLFKEWNQPFCMLLHEGREKDYALARDAVVSLPEAIEIVREPHPLKLKGIVGSCRAVISARYHGLINALSQNVPAMAIGWSHKYEELMADYQVQDAFIPLNSSPETISAKLNQLLDSRTREQWLRNISAASIREKEKAELMWQEVIACIRQ
jgi:polysaccharide pyruvyl transferase WcaK-like protein